MKEAGVSLGQGTATAETPKALRVVLDDLHRHCWIPRSQIHATSEVQDAEDEGEVVVSEWFAKQENLT